MAQGEKRSALRRWVARKADILALAGKLPNVKGILKLENLCLEGRTPDLGHAGALVALVNLEEAPSAARR